MIFLVAANRIFTAEELKDTEKDSGSQLSFVFFVKLPPMLIGQQDLFYRVFFLHSSKVAMGKGRSIDYNTST